MKPIEISVKYFSLIPCNEESKDNLLNGPGNKVALRQNSQTLYSNSMAKDYKNLIKIQAEIVKCASMVVVDIGNYTLEYHLADTIFCKIHQQRKIMTLLIIIIVIIL